MHASQAWNSFVIKKFSGWVYLCSSSVADPPRPYQTSPWTDHVGCLASAPLRACTQQI